MYTDKEMANAETLRLKIQNGKRWTITFKICLNGKNAIITLKNANNAAGNKVLYVIPPKEYGIEWYIIHNPSIPKRTLRLTYMQGEELLWIAEKSLREEIERLKRSVR
jgi:hypothetical protein